MWLSWLPQYLGDKYGWNPCIQQERQDLTTWQKCQAEILRYRDVLEAEQLPSYIVADRWKHPEQLREILLKLYNEQHLEGAVFIGDIPIPMIRKAQHMTSAFKMDEKKYPMIRSSVPSDRFYDDFDLKFDFLKQDSLNPLMFYYNLSAVSPQDIRCDIYTGRIKPVISEGLDKYQQIRDYLSKAVAAHQEANRLDQFVSYTGEGSYSNSLTAWRAEQQTLREQLPGVFDRKNNARFMRYSMWDYPKDDVITALKREDLDMMIFHEHGLPHRQYLSAVPSTHDYEQHMEILKREVRLKLRQDAEDGKDFRKRMCKWSEDFQVDTSWWTGITDTQMIRQDSLVNVHMGIVLEDVSRIAPNVRFVIFDACLMGGVEVAYEFKECADYLVFSPAEVLVPGFVYKTMMGHLMKEKPDLTAVAREFYEYYDKLSGAWRSATVTVLDVSKMEALANLAKELLAGVDGEKHLDIGHIQRYGYGWNNLYFDLGDYLETLYPQRVGEIEAALNACIVYKAHTPGYYSAGNGSYSAIDFYSGLTVYIPQEAYPYMNNEYKKMKWTQQVNPYIP